MIQIKVYLYDSETYRGEDLSAYLLQGSQGTEDITQELDRGEITLQGLDRKEAFLPETKFIIDRIDDEVTTYNYCVASDLVSQPILSEEYYVHNISLIEPSVIAQKRIVDNISATYKLKDVLLATQTAFDLNKQASFIFTEQKSDSPEGNFGVRNYTNFLQNVREVIYGKYFAFEGQISIINVEENTDFYQKVSGKVRFHIPKLAVYFGKENSSVYNKIGYASIDVRIDESPVIEQSEISRSWNYVFRSNSQFSGTGYAFSAYEFDVPELDKHWLPEKFSYERISGYSKENRYVRQYSDEGGTDTAYLTDEIDILPNKVYKVTITLHDYTNNPPSNSFVRYTGAPTLKSKITRTQSGTTGSYSYAFVSTYMEQSLVASTAFQTYEVNDVKYALHSSVPYSALALLQKAVLNSSVYEKKDGYYIADINARENGKLVSPCPFYVDEAYIDILKETQIIETFYNQKNLWEVLCEVGNYIHAIPEIVFGEDDKFMITFNRLGITEESESQTRRVSIFNSRGVEDYVSACSSYVSNMVQLGSVIKEWVAPKTDSEEYLVYNDTAKIIVSKPIIELIKVTVKCNKETVLGEKTIQAGAEADMTEFVYEKNVYQILSISPDDYPNKGVALYYELGESKIEGGQYRTPTVNSGDALNDYAIKKVIYSAFFGYTASIATSSLFWGTLYVNDFTFYVEYRTKDDVRQTQHRPDLRKYLLNSKHDKFPQHYQFNNQQETLIDSERFGSNIYGKLVRTGNLSYKSVEFCNSLSEMKHRGELYRINGDLYYVSKVTHTIYATHILSEVEYTKDYNQLSQVIGIPSEPRFYEISEQSQIRREVVLEDFIMVSLEETNGTGYLKDLSYIASLIFGNGDFARYALTAFKGDKDTETYGDQTLGVSTFYKEVLTPINAYASGNTLTFEWDMVDNFSAGDSVVESKSPAYTEGGKTYYTALRAVQYTDIYGKSALMDFYIIKDIVGITQAQIRELPNSFITATSDSAKESIDSYNVIATNVTDRTRPLNSFGLSLLKDCREAISINYNLSMLTGSDTFVLSSVIFAPNKQDLKIILLGDEVNKFSTRYLDSRSIMRPMVQGMEAQFVSPYFSFKGNTVVDIDEILSEVDERHFGDENNESVEGVPRVRAIALVYGITDTQVIGLNFPNKLPFIIARNIPVQERKAQATRKWRLGFPEFTKKQ